MTMPTTNGGVIDSEGDIGNSLIRGLTIGLLGGESSRSYIPSDEREQIWIRQIYPN